MKKRNILIMCLPVLCLMLIFAMGLNSEAKKVKKKKKGPKVIYTTDAHTNAVAEKIINSCTNASMSKEEKLRAVYYFLVRNMRYSWSTGSTKIKVSSKDIKETKKKAKKMNVTYSREFRNRYKNVRTLQGTCYGMNKVFCILANHLGYKAHMCHGQHVTGGSSSSHYWCYVVVKGHKKYFDVQYANRCYHRNNNSAEVESCYMGSRGDSYWRKHYH